MLFLEYSYITAIHRVFQYRTFEKRTRFPVSSLLSITQRVTELVTYHRFAYLFKQFIQISMF